MKGPFNTHQLHPQCGCSSEKMCEQRTWTVCCFLLGPKPVTLESIGLRRICFQCQNFFASSLIALSHLPVAALAGGGKSAAPPVSNIPPIRGQALNVVHLCRKQRCTDDSGGMLRCGIDGVRTIVFRHGRCLVGFTDDSLDSLF